MEREGSFPRLQNLPLQSVVNLVTSVDQFYFRFTTSSDVSAIVLWDLLLHQI
jgi:hypothetical protein